MRLRHARSARASACRRRCEGAWTNGLRRRPLPPRSPPRDLSRKRSARASIKSSLRLDSNLSDGGGVDGECRQENDLEDNESVSKTVYRIGSSPDTINCYLCARSVSLPMWAVAPGLFLSVVCLSREVAELLAVVSKELRDVLAAFGTARDSIKVLLLVLRTCDQAAPSLTRRAPLVSVKLSPPSASTKATADPQKL